MTISWELKHMGIMDSCRHSCWLKPWSSADEVGLEVTDRPQRLLREFENPHTENAGLLVLIGNESKQSAFRKLSFQTERVRGRIGGEIHLLASSFRDGRRKRIMVADTDVPHFLPGMTSSSGNACHEVSSYTAPKQSIPAEPFSFDSLLHKSLFPCADVICIFVDDLGGFKSSLEHLASWLKRGPSSVSKVQPRVLFIVKQEEKHQHQLDLQNFLRGSRRREADICFSNLTVVGVSKANKKRGRRRTQTRRWQMLGFAIAKALESGRQSRRRSNSLFTVYHLAYFLQYAASRALHIPLEPFSFIQVSRLNQKVAPDLSDHILEFLDKFRSLAALHRIAIHLIASSLLLDHYKLGMHLFDSHQVFNELYEAACIRASSQFEPRFMRLMPPLELVRLISCSMFTQFAQFQAIGSTVDWHRRQLAQNNDTLGKIRSNRTCLSCIRRRPQFGLSCGHLICRYCVKTFYAPSRTDPFEYRPESCLLCGQCTLGTLIRLTPETCRLHVLSIDGGGIRGSAPIEFIKAIQDGVGIPYYNVQRSFDVKVGTSSGALIVVCLGVLGWNVDDCMLYLKQFAEQSFANRQSRLAQLFSSLPFVSRIFGVFQFIHALLSDSKYAADGIEKSLLDTYGCDRTLTGTSAAAGLGGYVGVTLTRASDGSVFLATNYNHVGDVYSSTDYCHLESYDGQNEVKWWEVLRCATAAPFYFKPKCLGNHGAFQDGGVAVNNPVCIAVHEAISLTPDMAEPSIVVSLGTGSASDTDVESSSIFSNTFLPRLWRGLWRQASSRTAWDHFLSHQSPESKTKTFRFDVNYMEKEPQLDQVSGIGYVQQAACSAVVKSPEIRQLSCLLRARLFFFELNEQEPPYFARGAYQCSGRIMCLLRAQTPEYEAFMHQLCTKAAFFQLGTQSLEVSYEDISRDLCYDVKFAAPSLRSNIRITLNETAGEELDINGSPYPLDWLIKRQCLDASFGTSDHRLRNTSMIYVPKANNFDYQK
ncbi:related to calcium-independent phospholipase A2 [Fusarium mangiferae]|uniref:Related to calcium-independent phospholipase A2 n=1 Tax=Fusarium mangiferae TaxID=192010 RepID=A0A1L7UIJ8_FUSMA|nr:uncharacterized protein FMAN_14296 [Fusarium mangiferae]CVL09032.1 related to calcium-independent phospholipase A2 [Fusarium mangiferae]